MSGLIAHVARFLLVLRRHELDRERNLLNALAFFFSVCGIGLAPLRFNIFWR